MLALYKLGENNQAHCGYLGNEKSDTLAKKDPITQPCDFSQAADSQGYLGRGNKKENEKYELNGETHLTLRECGGINSTSQ